MRMTDRFVIGIDIGTSSVRGGLFNINGKLICKFVHLISVLREDSDPKIFEQSSDEIWQAVCIVCQVKTFIIMDFCYYFYYSLTGEDYQTQTLIRILWKSVYRFKTISNILRFYLIWIHNLSVTVYNLKHFDYRLFGNNMRAFLKMDF